MEMNLPNGFQFFLPHTDPLDNEDALMENLDMLANIARCKYQESAATVISIFEPIAVNFEVRALEEITRSQVFCSSLLNH